MLLTDVGDHCMDRFVAYDIRGIRPTPILRPSWVAGAIGCVVEASLEVSAGSLPSISIVPTASAQRSAAGARCP